nr:LysR family transcriptional regulator [Rhodoferax sp.]
MYPKRFQSAHSESLGNITVKQIRAFLAAVEHKNFSVAAQKVFSSQSAYSRCIQELELALGEKLFSRTNRGVALSEFGKSFLAHARALDTCYANAQSGLGQWRSERQGRLTLAGSSAVMQTTLPMLMARLHGAFEQPALLFEDCTSEQVVAKVLAGEVDFGVCTLTSEQSQLNCAPVLEAPLGLLVAPSTALPDTISSLDELKHISMVRFADSSVVSQILRSHGIAFEAYFASRLETCGVPGVFSLVRESGVAMVATGFGATHSQASDLRFIPLSSLLPSVSICIISQRSRPFEERLQVMKDVIRDSILATPWHHTVRKTNAILVVPPGPTNTST